MPQASNSSRTTIGDKALSADEEFELPKYTEKASEIPEIEDWKYHTAPLIAVCERNVQLDRFAAATKLDDLKTPVSKLYHDTLSIVHGNTKCSIHQGVPDGKVKQEEEIKRIFPWVASYDFKRAHAQARQHLGLETPKAAAGNWFLEIPQIKEWIGGIGSGNVEKRILTIYGLGKTFDPLDDASKTILTCRIISRILHMSPTVAKVAYYYCVYARHYSPFLLPSSGPNLEDIVHALCLQLVESANGVAVRPPYFRYASESTKKSTLNIWKDLLSDLISNEEVPIVFVIDSVDRFRPQPSQTDELLEYLGELYAQHPTLSILFSTETQLPIDKYFPGSSETFQADESHIRARKNASWW
ncbi:hypothetical protein BP6252_11968 [Coleophoma cylindrospora]|uniref:Nephrocystin 3-like N-terminal domain-containing protein n=1 Tax=Coleophoma cylindrospora TaxID=1849047 RepID=A0A3D8QFI6_9HELO|nr:hypothetical protein BP6252_11968 [Coleophoma cylindrospora]